MHARVYLSDSLGNLIGLYCRFIDFTVGQKNTHFLSGRFFRAKYCAVVRICLARQAFEYKLDININWNVKGAKNDVFGHFYFSFGVKKTGF